MSYFLQDLKKRVRFLVSFILFLFSTAVMAINPKVGVWWSPTESGRGFVFDGSGTVLAMQAYTYDRAGQPLWYLAVGQLTNNGVNWSGTLEKYVGGQCFGCAFQPNQSIGNDGVISVQFTSDTTGIMTMPNGMKSNIQSYFPAGTYPIGAAPLTGVAALYGTVTLNYKFTSFTTIFTDSFKFSASSLSSDGKTLVSTVIGSSKRVAGCSVAPASTSYGYMCMIMDTSDSAMDLFLFNLDSNKGISGRYEYCTSSTSLSSCSQSILTSPDGVVSGNIVSSAARAALVPNDGIEIDYSELKASMSENQQNSPDGAIARGVADPAAASELTEAFNSLLK